MIIVGNHVKGMGDYVARVRGSSGPEETTKKLLMPALARVTGDELPVQQEKEHTEDENPYYTLTAKQMEALVNGNIETIEGWVSNLDRVQATRLFRWLMKQS